MGGGVFNLVITGTLIFSRILTGNSTSQKQSITCPPVSRILEMRKI